MTEEEQRNKVYEILEHTYNRKVDFEHNEQGWYDPLIEDCYKDGIDPETVAHCIATQS